jgi:hypothetical protein
VVQMIAADIKHVEPAGILNNDQIRISFHIVLTFLAEEFPFVS